VVAAARIAIGEDVSWAENARDQIAALTVYVVNHRAGLEGPWTNPQPSTSTWLNSANCLPNSGNPRRGCDRGREGIRTAAISDVA
jgi:hypothetical protein